MIKRLVKIGLLIILFIAGWWLLGQLRIVPSFTHFFKEQPVYIDRTAVMIKDVRSLAQLITVSAYDEVVVDTSLYPLPPAKVPALIGPIVAPVNEALSKHLVLIGKVVSHTGIDMGSLQADAIHITGDSVHIALPPAHVLDVIINPSGVDVFIEKGSWDNAAINQLKNKIRRIAAYNVQRRGLLQQSENKAEEVLTRFFKAAGFKKVSISFANRAV
ncbi:MAG: DUF4230 domain-containing protein [Flavisolibacter sp.]|nr:DUF4230 domain-containing protein [Flavisolibacter sp.]